MTSSLCRFVGILLLTETFSTGDAAFGSARESAITIEYGACLLGGFSVPGEVDVYTFSATSGDVITIRMSEDSFLINPHIRLFAPDGAPVDSAWHATQARIDGRILLSTGTYTVQAFNDDPEWGGSYGLMVQRTFDPGQATALTYGDCVRDTIMPIGCHDAYTFSGSAGDVIVVRMSEVTGGMNPRVELFDPGGAALSSASDAIRAQVDGVTLPAGGTYTILASNLTPGSGGSYGLMVQRTFDPGQATALTYGDCVTGTIMPIGCHDAYTFSGSAGDVIVVRMSEVTGGMNPRVELFDPGGASVTSASGSVVAVISSRILPVAGQYTVLASNMTPSSGGGYEICLNLESTVSIPHVDRIPPAVVLGPPTPNPLRSVTSLSFSLPETAFTTMRIFDARGTVVATLLEEELQRGLYRRVWSGTDDSGRPVSAGVYFVRMDAGTSHKSRMIVLVN